MDTSKSILGLLTVSTKSGYFHQPFGRQPTGANLSNANLQGANLGRADLRKAYLFFADLQGAKLTYANLQGAVLERANLQGANLQGASLWGAILGGANLQGASLTQAMGLTGKQLDEACGDDKTKLPDYLAGYQMKPCPKPEQSPAN